jgi:hypothetical protein
MLKAEFPKRLNRVFSDAYQGGEAEGTGNVRPSVVWFIHSALLTCWTSHSRCNGRRILKLYFASAICGAHPGSDGGAARWAFVTSFLATAKLNDVEPFAYFKDVLSRLSDGHSMNQLDELLPWNWVPSTYRS